MKKSTKTILLILLISVLLLALTTFVFDIFREYIYAFVLLLTLAFSILFLGYTQNRNSNEKNMSLAMLVFTLLCQTLMFVILGFKLGFLSSGYHLGFAHLFKIVLPIFLIIILSEVLRYQLVEKGRESKLILTVAVIFFIVLDFLMASELYSLHTFKGLFEMFTAIIFPSIMKNILLTFVAYHYGYMPNIVYQIIMELSIYYLPVVPDISDFLNSILNILIPFIFLVYTVSYTNKIEICSKEKEKEKNKGVLNIIFIAILLIYAGLMSGMFKYYFLTIGSGSMTPTIEVGDMVLVEKIKDCDKLKVGDILVFKNGDRIVVHRIVEVTDEKNFKTKGDYNKAPDAFEVTMKDVIGKVNFKISKIGYPTIWLNELFEGGK